MKTKLITLFTTIFTLFFLTAQAQNECALKYNMLKTNYKTKNYSEGLVNLKDCLANCPSLTVNTYIYGGNLINKMLKKATPEQKTELTAVGKDLFAKRFEHFPDYSPAKANSDYADFLAATGGGGKDEIYSFYQKAFKIDPTGMSVKSIVNYFTEVVERNKDSNIKEVFNIYDVAIEGINTKLEGYSVIIKDLQAKKDAGQTLLKREETDLKRAEGVSKSIGQVETLFDQKMEEISTCEYLMPIYKEEYEANKTDKVWIERAINRMYKKDCTQDPFYVTLVGQYQEVAPSPRVSVLYAGILMDKGETNKAIEAFEKAISLETDPDKKGRILYKVADIFNRKGQRIKAVSYAKKAIRNKPNLGRAYTLIASAYQKSVNSCGKDEFEKRMVYVAAESYALKAARVDPGVAVYASKLAKSYGANKPPKKLIFNSDYKSGDSYTIKCWINETVRVP